MTAPPDYDVRAMLQDQLKELDVKLNQLEPRVRAAQATFEEEKVASEKRLRELAARWKVMNEDFVKLRMKREQVFKALGAA